MGKKYKRHHKTDPPSVSSEPPLKLVLKVGKDGASSSITRTVDSSFVPQEKDLPPPESPASTSGGRKKRKKKRKHEEKEKSSARFSDQVSDHTESEAMETEKEATEDDNESEVIDKEEEEIDKPSKQPLPAVSLPFKKLFFSEKRYPPRGPKDKDGVPLRFLEKDPLTKVLESIHRSIEKKDVDGFFAFPVTDLIAPGYSAIIAHPMDLSTMKKKIHENVYQNVEEYKEDFYMMCENCATYNMPETIYYKAAKKLEAGGQKIMSKERIAAMKRAFGYVDTTDPKPKPRGRISKKKTETNLTPSAGEAETTEGSERESVGGETDAMDETSSKDVPEVEDEEEEEEAEEEEEETEEEAQRIVSEVLQAAKEAKDRLSARKPKSQMGFLRREKDGTTTLNFLSPANLPHPQQRVVTLGVLTGRLNHGSGSLPGFREDKRNKALPINYLNFGPFGSYAPHYDSTFSNLSKEESDLLYSTYGDKSAVQYAESIQTYVKDCDSYVTRLVDNLLDTLTKGEHSKAMEVLKENQQSGKANNPAATKEDGNAIQTVNSAKISATGMPKNDSDVDFDSLRSLSDLGIDMSFLPAMEKELKPKEEPKDISSQLNETCDLIGELEKSQNERLSRKPPHHLQYIPGPSAHELSVAEKLHAKLQKLTSQATPGDVVSSAAIANTIGISQEPIITIPDDSNQPISTDTDDDIEIIDDSSDPPRLDEGVENNELVNLLEGTTADQKPTENESIA